MDDLAADVLSANLPYSSTGNQSVVENPKLLQPFALGWKREVVMRIITDNKKPNCDIYYFHPNGKKLRSTTEVKANLSDGLDLECFSFQKRTLNVEGEMVRQAKIRGRAAAKFRKVDNGNVKAPKVPRNKTKEIPKSKVSDISKPEIVENSFGSGRPRSKRQSMIRKKQQLKALMNFKKSKQTKIIPEKKKPKKIEKKGKSSGEETNDTHYNNKSKTNKRGKSLKNKNLKKSKQAQRGQSPEKSKQEKLAEKLCIANEVRDLKSIVQKNIVKYREMRKKELMKKIGENTIEEDKPESSNKANYRHRSEPISQNLEIYLKPLEKGWKRELVYRVNGALPSNQSDVYYYHPNGRKFRSAREVAEHLTPGLTLDYFTFRKEPIGCGEPQEIIRNARANRKNLAASKEKLILVKGRKN